VGSATECVWLGSRPAVDCNCRRANQQPDGSHVSQFKEWAETNETQLLSSGRKGMLRGAATLSAGWPSEPARLLRAA
jgi:hypothetical protein